MRRKAALPELLAPAGNIECLYAAVAAGADAVYVGAKRFNARAYAGNFDTEELRLAVEYCHLYGVKLYVTLNTLLFDKELPDALSLVGELYSLGVDALIVADLGLIRLVRERYPDFELHASTQLSVHNTPGADAAYRLGCSRVVLARELSRENISAAVENSLAECEIFLHGALCVCHSGQCLFSSMVGGRSGNRGSCAQPCRLPYNGDKYPLSLSDLSLCEHIRELVEMGVSSLKIEGRMKSREYVYNVTSVYRRLLDECRPATAEERRTLERVFSRGGFTDGYFRARPESRMTGVRSEEDKRATKELESREFSPKRVAVSADLSVRAGEPVSLTFTLLEGAMKGKSATAYGPIPDEARTSALDEGGLVDRIGKLGATLLRLDRKDARVELDGGLNLSPAAINALRRECAERLTFAGRALPENGKTQSFDARIGEEGIAPTPCVDAMIRGESAQFLDPVLYEELKSAGELSRFSACFLPLWRLGEISSVPEGVYLPPVITDTEREEVLEMLRSARDRGVKLALVGNIGAVKLARDAGFTVIGDFRFNIMNSFSYRAVADMGVSDSLLSVELPLPAARAVGGRALVYGRIPLMLTERCFIRENFGCNKCSKCSLTDRKGAKFPLVREWQHRNLILNSAPVYVGDRMEEVTRGGRLRTHYLFTVESVSEARGVLAAFRRRQPYPFRTAYRRIGMREVKE